MDIPRIFNITESAHRIHNPITPEKLATLGAALRLESGARVLDLGSGSGEMLCTWARDHGVIGTAIERLAQSLRPGGIILIGEPYWRQLPPTEDVARGCLAGSISEFLRLPELSASFR